MGTWNFSYDAVDRLTAAAIGSNAPTPFQSQTASWSYDSFGNRTAQTFSNGAYSNWAHYNLANNRITSSSQATGGYVYDASGNTLDDGQNEYWYDAEGQQCAVQGKAVAGMTAYQYLYDAEGARIAKFTLASPPAQYTLIGTNLGSSPTCAPPPAAALTAPGYSGSGVSLYSRYLVDLGGDQVTELNMSGGALVWTHSNIFAGTRLTATYDRSGLHYELADPLGSRRILADVNGNVQQSCTSLPHGDGESCPTTPTEHLFTGKERDTESGNDYFGARYYSSNMGRFLSPDWSAKEEPVPYATMDNPQSLNLYSYVQNNPLSHVDSDGHAGDIAVIENGPDATLKQRATTSEGNPVGHSAIAITGRGVFSFGNSTPLGSSASDYVSKQSSNRDSTITIIKTTPEQDAAAAKYLTDTAASGKSLGIATDNCSSRTNGALDAAGIPGLTVPVAIPATPVTPGGLVNVPAPTNIPGTAGARAAAAGGTTITVPKGSTTVPQQVKQFDPPKKTTP
jgi:RHS repeat-associated protein